MNKTPIAKITALTILFFSLVMIVTNLEAAGKAAIVTAHPLATEAGKTILIKGGTAADAAIAAALVLSVVEPQHSGLGGGGVALYYDKDLNQHISYDYMPIAPFTAHEKASELQDTKLNPSKTGPLGVAIPAFILGLEQLHKKHGKLPWQDLVQPAIDLAESGFVPDNILTNDIKIQEERFKNQKNFKSHFSKAVSSDKKNLFIQKNLAQTLKKISTGGAKEFYFGSLSRSILKELELEKTLIREDDFISLKTLIQQAERVLIRDKTLYLIPHPSNGGKILSQLLTKVLETRHDATPLNMAEFMETAFKEWYKESAEKKTNNDSNVLSSTTHICVLDGENNMISMTNSLNDTFGSGVFLPGAGFLLNNFVDEYDLQNVETIYGFKRRDRLEHALTPVMIRSGLDPWLVIGTTGGKTISQNLFQILYTVMFEGQTWDDAIKARKFYVIPEKNMTLIEKDYDIKKLPKKSKFKTKVTVSDTGNTQAISISKGKPRTYSDPRGQGKGVIVPVK